MKVKKGDYAALDRCKEFFDREVSSTQPLPRGNGTPGRRRNRTPVRVTMGSVTKIQRVNIKYLFKKKLLGNKLWKRRFVKHLKKLVAELANGKKANDQKGLPQK